MANRVVITICGEEYTLVADETSAYMQKVGSCVSDKMTEVMNDAKVGRTDAAVLTAVNLTDELFKSQAAAEPNTKRMTPAPFPSISPAPVRPDSRFP